MDRNRKRKATDAASPKVENSASKRQKTRLVSVWVGDRVQDEIEAASRCGLWTYGEASALGSPSSTVMVARRSAATDCDRQERERLDFPWHQTLD